MTRAATRSVLLVILASAAWLTPNADTTNASAVLARPSIILVLTDDQRWDTVSPTLMPNVAAHIVADGTWYPNAFVSDPLCCPSRASILTGNYAHTTGVFANGGDYGGFKVFTSRGNDASTIAVDLWRSGYRTALVGKYLNGYPGRWHKYIPPGWTRWFAVPNRSYYDYSASDQGVRTHFGSSKHDYVTRVLGRVALRFIDASERQQRPFFLYFSTTAPHGPAIPDPRDAGRFSADPTTLPDYGEVDASKPAYIRDLTWSSTTASDVQRLASNQLNSTYGVDRAFGKLWRASPDGTIFLFLSDNGYLWGEHRWHSKYVPYDPSIRIPFGYAVKGTSDPGTDRRLLLNVDIRSTLERLAGVGLSEPVEGMDFLGDAIRDSFVLEHEQRKTRVPTYCGVRSRTRMYVRYATGEEELYDETADPAETTNLAAAGSGVDPDVLASARQAGAAACRLPNGIYPLDWPFATG